VSEVYNMISVKFKALLYGVFYGVLTKKNT